MTEFAHEVLSVGQVFAKRVRDARRRRGWTQQQLAERLTGLGVPTDRTTVLKIERGGGRASNVPLRELFAFAHALDVAPVHLLVPLEDDQPVAITPRLSVPPNVARDWIRGRHPLSPGGVRAFLGELPEDELRALVEESVYGDDPLRKALGGPIDVRDIQTDLRETKEGSDG